MANCHWRQIRPKKSTQNKKVRLNELSWLMLQGRRQKFTWIFRVNAVFFDILGFWVDFWASKLRAIPPPPFLSVSPVESMRSGGAIAPLTKGVSQRYWRETLWKQGKWVRIPLCDAISKRYCAIGGVSRTGPLRLRADFVLTRDLRSPYEGHFDPLWGWNQSFAKRDNLQDRRTTDLAVSVRTHNHDKGQKSAVSGRRLR